MPPPVRARVHERNGGRRSTRRRPVLKKRPPMVSVSEKYHLKRSSVRRCSLRRRRPLRRLARMQTCRARWYTQDLHSSHRTRGLSRPVGRARDRPILPKGVPLRLESESAIVRRPAAWKPLHCRIRLDGDAPQRPSRERNARMIDNSRSTAHLARPGHASAAKVLPAQ